MTLKKDVFVNLNTTVGDLININDQLPVVLRLEVEDRSVKVYASSKPAYKCKPSYSMVIADSNHAITRHTKNGANISDFIRDEESKAKFSEIEALLKSNNITEQDIENYIHTLNNYA
jgi:hypothetical protein